MPSAHGPILSRKQLREKIIRRSDFLSEWVSAHDRTFYRRQNIWTYLGFFYRSVIWLTRPDFLLEVLCLAMAGESLLDYVTPIFFIGLKPAIFFIADKLSEGKVRFIFGPKVSAHEPIFSFFVYDKKNRSVCAVHKPPNSVIVKVGCSSF